MHVDWHKWPKEKPAKGSDRNKFLLTFKTKKGSYYTSMGEWYDKYKEWASFSFDEVIAWAELPEPYKPEELEDNHPDAITARKYAEGDPETVKALRIFDE